MERSVLDLPELCKRLRLSVQEPWNVEHISSYSSQENDPLSQTFPNDKRNQNLNLAQPLDSSKRRLNSTRWSRGSRGLLDSEESKRKPIAVPPPAGNSFAPKPMTLPQLTTVTPSLKKKYDRLPKATEMMQQFMAKIDGQLTEDKLYHTLRKEDLHRRRHFTPGATSNVNSASLSAEKLPPPKTAPGRRPATTTRRKRARRPRTAETDAVSGMRRNWEEAKTNAAVLKKRIKQRIAEVRRNVFSPEVLLKLSKRDLEALKQDRALMLFKEAVARAINYSTYTAMSRWKDLVRRSIEVERSTAAVCVQQAWRASQARQNVRERREMRNDLLLQEYYYRQKQVSRRMHSSVRIQTILRRYFVRDELPQLRREHRAASTLQQQYRCHVGRRFFAVLVALRRRRYEAAVVLQKLARVARAKQLAQTLRAIRASEREQKLKKLHYALIRDKFRKAGAAVTIQNFFRETISAYQRREKTRFAAQFRKMKLVLRLQRRWRAFKIRLDYLRKKNAVVKLQFRVRGFLAKLLLRRKRRDFYGALAERRMKREKQLMDQKFDVSISNKKIFSINISQIKRGLHKTARFFNVPIRLKATREKAALNIQRIWRSNKARDRLKRILKRRVRDKRREITGIRHDMATFLQRFFRGTKARNKIWADNNKTSVLRIQRVWRKYWAKKIHSAAAKIQAFFKQHWHKSVFKAVLQNRAYWQSHTIKIQSWVRRLLAQKRCDAVRLAFRENEEQMSYALASFKVIVRGEMDRIIIRSFKQRKARSEHGLTRLYNDLCHEVGARNFDGVRWVKMFARAKGFMNHPLAPDRTALDLLFARHKTTNKRNLTYKQFVAAMKEISHNMYSEVLSRRLIKGVWTPLFCLVDIHLLVKGVPFAKTALKTLRRAAEANLNLQARRIQRFFFLHVTGKKLLAFNRRSREEYDQRMIEVNAATKLQLMYKRRHARRLLLQLLNSVYTKYIDSKTGSPYYFNNITNRKSWYKPALLHDGEDLDRDFRLPDKHTEFIVRCVQCETKQADVFCLDCEEPYCQADFDSTHRVGHRKEHRTEKIRICKLCKYQAATRRDYVTSKPMCDNCFLNEYRDKDFHKAPWRPIVGTCVECEIYAARWMCKECDDAFCTNCFGEVHAKGNRLLHSCRRLNYYSETLRRMKEKTAEERAKEQRKIAREKVIATKRLEVSKKAALLLQTVWRGRGGRLKGRGIMRHKRITRRNDYFRLKAEEDMKKTFEYKVKKFGVLAKSFVTQSRDDRLRELLPGTGAAEQDSNIIRTTDDLYEALEDGDRIQVGEEKFYVLEVAGDVITPHSVPLNIEYKGESDVGLSLYKLPQITGVYKVFHGIGETIKKSGFINKIGSKLKAIRNRITKSKQFQKITSKLKEAKDKITKSEAFQKVQSKLKDVSGKLKDKISEAKHALESETDLPDADTAEDNEDHGAPHESEVYADPYSQTNTEGQYLEDAGEYNDPYASYEAYSASDAAAAVGFDDSNGAAYADASDAVDAGASDYMIDTGVDINPYEYDNMHDQQQYYYDPSQSYH